MNHSTRVRPRRNGCACGRQARLGHGYQLLRFDTREESTDNSLVIFERGQNIVANRRAGRSAPTTVNSSVRTREYLTRAEIERLMAAARKSSRYGHRDATMILIGYRHGLRPSCANCNGRRSSWPPAGYTSAGRRTARRVSTRCRVTRYARCDACSANRGHPRTSS